MTENINLAPMARAAVATIQEYLETGSGHNVQSQHVKVAYMTLELMFRYGYLDDRGNPTEESTNGQSDES